MGAKAVQVTCRRPTGCGSICCFFWATFTYFYMEMRRNDSVPDSMTHQTKKKHVEDQSLPSDAGKRPIQLQRRRVWRACESCRSVSDSYHYLFHQSSDPYPYP